MHYVLIAYNTAVFLMFGLDKLYAVKNKRRISEKTLLLTSLFMGAAGGFFGMIMFSHKTRKLKFRILLPLFLILNVLINGFLSY